MADLDKIDNDILNELMSDPKTVTPPEDITEDVEPLMLDEVDEDIFKEQVANNPPPMLVQSVEAGKTKDPDAFAEAKRLSRATGIPVDAVESDVPRAKAIEAPEYDISKSWNDNPAVAQWMSDPNNAGVAHDVVEDLAKIEDKLKPEKPGAVSNAARNTAKRAVDLSKNFLGFVTSLGKPVIASRLEDLQSEDRLSAFAAGEEYKPLATAEGPDFKIDENRPIKILNSVNKKLTSDFGYIPENTWETTKKAFADNGAVSADAWGELLAYSFESGAASLVDMGAMVAAMPVYIASRTKEMGDERAKNKGMAEATPQEMGEAMPFVLGSIILDKLSLGKMLGVGKGAAEEVGKEALKHVVKKGAAAVGTEMTTEFIQEGVIEYIGEKYGTDAKMSFAEAADRGLGGAVAAGPMSAVMSGTAGVINSGVLEKKQKTSQEKFTEKTNAAIQEYTDEQQKLDEIIELSQGIVNRDPVAANELFGLVQEKYEVEDIHIDGAEFVSVMDELGIDPNDPTYATAFESAMDESTGRDVTLTLGEYMTNYANLEPLRPHVRLSADGLSQNELITAPAERDNVLSRMVNESRQNVEEAAASKEIYESVKTQLFDAGVLTGKEAGLAASIFPAMMQQHAAKRGITIQEAYETIPGITISSDNVKPLPEAQDGIKEDAKPLVPSEPAPALPDESTLRDNLEYYSEYNDIIKLNKEIGGVASLIIRAKLDEGGTVDEVMSDIPAIKAEVEEMLEANRKRAEAVREEIINQPDVADEAPTGERTSKYFDIETTDLGKVTALVMRMPGGNTATFLSDPERGIFQTTKHNAAFSSDKTDSELAADAVLVFEMIGEPVEVDGSARDESSDNVKPLPEVTLSQAKEQGYEGDDIAEASEWSQAVEKFGDEGMTQESRMQRAQEQGYDTETVYYHGTDADIEAFELPSDSKTAGSGIFLTTDSDKAQTYTGPRGGNISPVVVKSDNILELDANGENWNEIEIDNLFIDGRPISDLVEEMEEGDYTTTDELAMIVKSMGYDGLKLQNVKDKGVNTQLYDAVEYLQEQGISVPTRPDGSYDFADIDSDVFAEARQYAEGVGGGASDTTVIFDPSNIRSVNAAFDPEQSDSANLLAQSGKPEINVYHGSPHIFDSPNMDNYLTGEGGGGFGYGFHVTDRKDTASDYSIDKPLIQVGTEKFYANENEHGIALSILKDGYDKVLKQAEENVKKYPDLPFPAKRLDIIKSMEGKEIIDRKTKGKIYDYKLGKEELDLMIPWEDKVSSNRIVSSILEKEGFDVSQTGKDLYYSIADDLREDGDTTGGDKAASKLLKDIGIHGIRYIDPIGTAFNEGDVNYNYTIFSPEGLAEKSIAPELNQSPVDESSEPEENLYVAHNLSEENLLHVDELGGLAAPSIAIARVDKGDFESFGGITLIADPEIAVSNKAKAFDADVYSPRHPQATYTLDRQAKREYENEIGRLPDRFTEYGTPELVRNAEFIDYYLDKVGATPKSFQAKVSPEVKAGVKLLAKHRTVYDLKSDPKFIKLAEKLGQANYDSYVSGMDDLVARKKRISEIKKREFNEADYIEQEKAFAKDAFMGESAIDSLADQVHKHSQKGGIDTGRLADDKRKRMKQKKHKDGIQAEAKEWADKLISGKQMFAGHTPGGDKKYKPYNLENIVKEMTKGLQGEENFFYGVGNVRAKHAKQYKSVAGMAADRDRIVSAEEMETIKEESNAKFIEIVEKLKPFYKYDAEGFGFTDDVGNAIADNNYQDFNLTAGAKKDIAEFIGYLKSLPTQYFESKVQRAVDLSEFHTAIVPNGTGKEAINILKRKGLIVKKYKDSETKEKAIRATGKLFQEKRASVGYTGTDYMVSLGKQSDRSSFLHEAGHIFLDIERVFAEKYGVTDEQQNWLTHLGAESFDDIDFFKWADVQRRVNAGDTSLLGEHGLTNDELTAKVTAARDSHEQFAEEFETYLMEGKAPSVSLRNAFRAFKDWLVSVYRGMKVNNITLSRDVKGMFDRLLASEEEIAAMQAVYGFDDSTKESGKAKAKETLESKIFKQWKRQTEKWWKDETKAEIEERIATLKETRTYSAETWLSENKVNAQQAGEALGYREEKVSKSDDVDPSVDSISIAVAKLGGIDRDEAEGHGIDPATWKGKLNNNSPVFGKPIFRKEGGDSFDGMATRIAQYGYTDDPHLLIELIDQDMNGDPQYSNEVDFDLLFAKAEDQEALIPMPKRLYGLTAADGMDIDLAANQLGYKSGDEMLRDIAASRPIAMQASTEANTFMLDKYGDILNDGTIEEEARLAVHNEEQGKQLLVELRAMNNQNKKPTLINRDMLKRAAEDAIDSLKVKDIKPEKYHRAEVKAAQEVVRHQANGDTEMAIQEKTNQLLNFYLYREALKAKTNTDRWRKHNQGVKTRKYSAGSVNGEYINQMKVYAAAFDFRKSPDPKAINDLRGLALWIQAQNDTNPEGYRPQFYHQVLSDLANPAINTDDITLQSYSDMTVGELRSVFETLQHLRYIGGKLSENDKAQAKLEADTVTASINANAGEDKPRNKHGRKGGGFKRGVADFGWSQARAFLHIQEFDGWKKDAANGVLYKAIWQKMLDASDINVALKMDMAAKVKDVLNVDRLKQKTMKTFTGVDGTDFSLELSERVMFAVYWGSPESRQSLLETSAEGREISLAEANRILDSLTDEDIKIVEGIWKLNDSLKDRMFQTQRDVHGVAPKAVEAMPFTIRGKVLSGGYQKIRYEWDAKDTAGREDTMTEALQGISNAGVSMTKAGSMNERVGSGGRQISLNIGNVTQALEESVQFISFARTSVEVHKIMNNSGVKSAIVNKYGMERYRAFLDSLNGTFAGDVVGQTGGAGIAKFMRKTRSNMSMAMLMFSIRNIVQQFVGGTNLMVELKMKDYFSASGDFMSDRDKWVSFVNDKSPMMRYRMALTNKEVSDAAIGLEASATNSWLVDRGYLAQTLIDKAISMPAWLAGYRKGLGLYNDEKLAAQYADEIVVSAMGSGQAKDLAPMFSGAGQGGNQLAVEAMKQLAFMGSFFNMVGQIYYKAYKTNNLKTAEGIGEFSRQISWTLIIPAIVSALVVDDIPDEEDPIAWAAKKIASYGLGSVMLVREIAGVWTTGFSPSQPISNTLKAASQLVSTPAQVMLGEKEMDSKAAISLLRDVTPFIPLPGSYQAARTMQGLMDEDQSWYGAFVEGEDKNK